MANPLEVELSKLDESAPLCIGTLARLLNAQSKVLLGEFNKRIDELNEKISSQDKIISDQAQEIATLKEENKALRYDIEDTQQYSRRNSIRISGISESADEKPEDINKKIRDLFTQSLNVVVNDTDLCRLHRTGKSKDDGTPRQILVKFTNYSARRRVLKARNKLQRVDKPTRIFINEDLTRQRYQLARKARSLKKDKIFDDTWTHDGKIFIKIHEQINVVTTMEKLMSLVPK